MKEELFEKKHGAGQSADSQNTGDMLVGDNNNGGAVPDEIF